MSTRTPIPPSYQPPQYPPPGYSPSPDYGYPPRPPRKPFWRSRTAVIILSALALAGGAFGVTKGLSGGTPAPSASAPATHHGAAAVRTATQILQADGYGYNMSDNSVPADLKTDILTMADGTSSTGGTEEMVSVYSNTGVANEGGQAAIKAQDLSTFPGTTVTFSGNVERIVGPVSAFSSPSPSPSASPSASPTPTPSLSTQTARQVLAADGYGSNFSTIAVSAEDKPYLASIGVGTGSSGKNVEMVYVYTAAGLAHWDGSAAIQSSDRQAAPHLTVRVTGNVERVTGIARDSYWKYFGLTFTIQY